jgi:hypothetical protein
MRHVLGFGLAIVMAVAVFFGGSWGYLRLLRIPVPQGAVATLPAGGGSLLHDRNTLLAFAALAGVALLAGILVGVPRISPLAAGLPGLMFIAWTVVYVIRVQQAVHYIPLKSKVFGDGFEALLFNGALAALGIAMIVPLFVPSRWRGRADDADAAPADTTVGLLTDWGGETAPLQ